MAVKLYEHNTEAYRAAVRLLAETGKAVIAHPTGTGKSFIGFKLAEDNPDKRVLWLTPSEYIVKTQLENLRREGGAELANITFVTYQRLMGMSREDIAGLKPDICVADEHHRLGAERWSEGFTRLRATYPEMKLLGLSATNIRYLDNQRNMADELFDGNIASEISLGEAIARGILPAPKYVIAVYEYQKELEKYQRRVERVRGTAVRSAGEKYLDALRRALDKADGLDRIFEKHITDKTGKYIIFCANREHMEEMIGNAAEWFGRVDKHPAIYCTHSDNPESSREFAAFKADDGEHLKLLFCIDMLNEGVHVDDIAGVILLRPTVSPIIYKQQIGRALAAGKKKTPVIFDIVLNFENLYSISDLKEEMSEAIRFYQTGGEEYEIVNDAFTVIDEVRECGQLFNELERTLSASWDCMYRAAGEYYRRHGNLLPPQKYTDDNGYRLGRWVTAQRTAYSNGDLSSSRILRLEQIGMEWIGAHERQWEESFKKAKAYADKNGGLAPNAEGYSEIGNWISKQRIQYRKGALARERIERLSEIGMIWETEDRWQARYAEAKAYYEQNGSLDIPADYVSKSGASLGRWYRDARRRYLDGTLSPERKRLLEDIGMDAVSVKTRTWMSCYELAKEYYEKHGDLRVGAKYATDTGENLGVWISGQRYMRSKGKLKKEQIDLLDKIGMIWQGHDSRWDAGCEYAERYRDERGDINPPAEYVTDDGFALGKWIAVQRRSYKNGKLSDARKRRLDSLGIIWDMSAANWETGFSHLCDYRREYGDALVDTNYIAGDGYRLGAWTANQRSRRRSGALGADRISRLDGIGFVWEPQKARWMEQYAEAKRYFERNGNMAVSKTYVAGSGIKLRYWVDTQKKAYKNGSLDGGQIERLERIGIV